LESVVQARFRAFTTRCFTGPLSSIFTVVAAVVGDIVTVFVDFVAADFELYHGSCTASPLATDAALVARPTLGPTLSLFAIDTAATLFVGLTVTVVVAIVSAHLCCRASSVTGTPDTAPAGLGSVPTLGHTGSLVAIATVVGDTLTVDAAAVGTILIHSAALARGDAPSTEALLALGTGTSIATAER